MIDPTDIAYLEPILNKIPLPGNIPTESLSLQKLPGLSNENFLLRTKTDQYILKIPKQSTQNTINRDNEFHNTEIACQLGLTPRILWHDDTGVSLRAYLSNAQEMRLDTFSISQLAPLMNKLQSSQVDFKGLLDNQEIAVKLEAYYRQCSLKQQKESAKLFKETICQVNLLEQNPHPDIKVLVPAHIDLIKENILINPKNNKTWLIDWEYSAMASCFWDIAMLSNSLKLDKQQAFDFLEKIKPDYEENEAEILRMYRTITNNINELWVLAYK